MTDLVTFIRARLAEREELAQLADRQGYARWEPGEVGMWRVDPDGSETAMHIEERQHIAANDPAYVLRDIAAKRQILDLVDLDYNDEGGPICLGGFGEAYWDVARILALPFSDHPDYQQEWKLP